tara:strand:- start:5173 stop:6504 length:1332 start_codon:yes stop_codon:yes gene_type:complete
MFRDEEGVVLLHSAKPHHQNGRYSYLGVRPFYTIISKNSWIKTSENQYKGNVLELLQQHCHSMDLECHAGLPPFQGGGMGAFSYDLGQSLEMLPPPQSDEFVVPDVMFGFYDLVISWDHKAQNCYLLSSGLPKSTEHRAEYAQERMDEVLHFIQESSTQPAIPQSIKAHSELQLNFKPEDYMAAIQKAIDYIYAGDLFEVNISQRFHIQSSCHAFDLYLKLQQENPAPFAGYLNFNGFQIISSSPERFLKLQQGQVEACPIKGTRPRGKTEAEDKQLAEELINSIKDRAENIMIVDLMRNDLSKVCLPHSIKVPEICGLHSFATVHHLISTVQGTLAPEYDAIDVIKATFPGGSITGAPKIRAMEIIAEIEPTARGAYCGSMGYIGFDGGMDLSILIRTFVKKGEDITFQAGGAIVSDSDPEAEYQETLDKAAALKRVLCAQI